MRTKTQERAILHAGTRLHASDRRTITPLWPKFFASTASESWLTYLGQLPRSNLSLSCSFLGSCFVSPRLRAKTMSGYLRRVVENNFIWPNSRAAHYVMLSPRQATRSDAATGNADRARATGVGLASTPRHPAAIARRSARTPRPARADAPPIVCITRGVGARRKARPRPWANCL